jgi:ribonuclease BN (tRNA processing enzyme)
MHATLLGTGSPIPTLERAGTSLLLDVGDDRLLVDCGPKTTHRLVEEGVDPGTIETVFFTHRHVDHDADFFHFAVASWSLGRETLSVYGPDGTADLVDALGDLYADDIAYRKRFDYPEGGMDVDVTTVSPGFEAAGDGWQVAAHPVEHSVETYAYRFEAGDASLVVSGDTRHLDSLAEFAAGADVLVQDACAFAEPVADPDEPVVWERLTEPLSDEHLATLQRTHCTPREAGRIAANAGVETLVLTHLLPYRDTTAMRAAAEATFDGHVLVAEDGLELDLSQPPT